MTSAVILFSLCIGSFLNVCISRLPRGQSLWFPSSHCPHCRQPLNVGELIPLVSYLWQRGHCRSCGVPISRRYPLTELATAGLFWLAWECLGWQLGLLRAWLLAASLLVVAVVDAEHQLIPDELNLWLGWWGLCLLPLPQAPSWSAALGASLGGGGLLLALAWLSRGGMGGGDIKLLLALGPWLGWPGMALCLFFAFAGGGLVGLCLLASGRKRRGDAVAFGPFLAAAAYGVLLGGDGLWQAYAAWMWGL